MTIPLWTLPLPIIAVAIIDWAIENARKIAAERSRPRTPLSRERLGGDITHVRVISQSQPKDAA